MRKRLLSALLAMAMMLTMLPTAAFAAGEGKGGETAATVTLEAGFEMEAAKAEEKLGITKDDDSSAWCDPKTMYLKINNAQDGDKYKVVVTKGQDEIWIEPQTGDGFTFDQTAAGERSFARMYFAFGEDPNDGGQHSLVSEEKLSAGEYTFTVTRTPKDAQKAETLTTTIELVSDNKDGYQVKDPVVEPEVPTVVPAPIVDHSDNPITELGAVIVSKVTAVAGQVNTYAVTVTGTGIVEHTNAAGVKGTWVGFGMPIDGTSTYSYALVESGTPGNPIASIAERVYEVGGEKYNTVYFDTAGEYTIQQKKGDDVVAVYVVTVKITPKGEAGKTYTATFDVKGLEANVTPTIAVTAGQDKIEAQEDGSYVLTRGTEYTYTVTAQGYKEAKGKVTEPAEDKETIKVEVTMEKAPVAKPELLKAGFNMDPELACEGINAALKVVRPSAADNAVPQSDVAINTMFVAIDNMVPEKDYQLVVTNAANKTVYTSKDSDLKNVEKTKEDTVVYFTFDRTNPGSTVNEGIVLAEGKYTFTLNEKVAAVAPATEATWKKIASTELNLAKVTLDENKGEGSEKTELFAAQNGKLKITTENPSQEGYTFVSWNNDDDTIIAVKDEIITVAQSVVLKAQWRNEAVAAPSAAASEVKVPENASAALKEVEDVVKQASANAREMARDKSVVAAADAVAEKLDVEKLLKDVNQDDKDNGYTKIQVQVYLEIAPKDYVEGTKDVSAKLTLDITPKYQVVAVKTDEQGTISAQKKIDGQTGDLTGAAKTTADVEITVALPAGFGKVGSEGAWVSHKGMVQGATVADVPATGTEGQQDYVPAHQTATFTNTHGFSTFVISAENPTAATIGTDSNKVSYETLQAAVDAVADGGEIQLVKAGGSAVVKEEKTFKIVLVGSKDEKAPTITAASGLKVTPTENKEGDKVTSITYKVEKSGGSTNPGGPGGIGGGSSGSATYSVNVPTAEHGTVTVNPRNAAKDATVTITVAPDKGYHLESLTVTDKDGNKIELTKVDATKYTFKMPASRVEVKAVFAEGEAPAISFTDVAEGEYYYDAVLWAVNKGVTNGLTDTTFGPNASCTRAQMVTFLWRAAGSPEPTSTTTAFTDIDSNEYYYKAVLWAVEKGITTGTTETTFSPNATVTRAQTVTFLYRYAGTPAVSGNNNFTDLEAGEYYVDAVQWAATNGITTGTTETTFSPANNCTRGQIVTFLYRHIVK